MNYTILNRDELPRDANTYEFVGSQYQDTEVSFIWVDMPPGGTIRLHKHPYKEIFIIQEGWLLLPLTLLPLRPRQDKLSLFLRMYLTSS